MKKFLGVTFTLLLVCFSAVAIPAQDNMNTNGNTNASVKAKKRGPVFRATKEQIKQAQVLLKQRGLYAGESTSKLDADTRSGLKKYQEAEGIKVTGTLNRATLEKMNIVLTDKQKTR
jgi:peptidoglycan hydrolase-like protein with peptidoglycan-binding domain